MNYTELHSAIKEWIDDTTISDATIDTFISLTEAKMNRTLRVMDMVVKHPFTPVDGGEYYDLPADFLGARQISIGGYDLDYLTPEQFDGVLYNYVTNGRPRYYTIIGNQLRFKPTTTVDSNIEMWYYQSIPEIVTNNTNWIGDKWPDAYLYGGLAEANIYVYDDAKAQQYGLQFANVVSTIDQADKKDRWSGSAMVTRIIL